MTGIPSFKMRLKNAYPRHNRPAINPEVTAYHKTK